MVARPFDDAELAPTANGALERLRPRRHRLAANVMPSASAEHNPALSRRSVLGRFLEMWERIFVLCYKDSCRPHTAQGARDGRRVWWPSIQQRVTVFDASYIDDRNAAIIEWAGCNVAGAPAGRSGELATREPCTFARPGGGKDWRRTAKHRLMALLAHLTLVEEAARLNLTRVMILEADAVPSLANEELSVNRSRAARISRRLAQILASEAPWSVLRLSGIFYSQEFAPRLPGGGRRCSDHCRCVPWPTSSVSDPQFPWLCEIRADPSPSDTVLPMVARLGHWCDVRDTAAYAIHRRAFATFTGYLGRLRGQPGWLRNGANDVPAIDNWIPHALPSVYALPTLVSQPFAANDSQGATALMRQTSARQFARWCVGARENARTHAGDDSKTDRRRRSMKMSSFATRHIYLMREDSAGGEAE